MAKRRKRLKFTLVRINSFDARQGYKRCSINGVAGETDPHPLAFIPPIPLAADFWRNRNGGLVVRFSSNQPYVFHFEAFLDNGEQVPEKDIDEFADYVLEVLIDWGGADDPPDPEIYC